MSSIFETYNNEQDDTKVENIYFPPRKQCDFVIHYGTKSFFVHQVVLMHHSVYFREYIDSLDLEDDNIKRRKLDVIEDNIVKCQHASHIRCIYVPPIPLSEINNTDTSSTCDANALKAVLSYMYFRRHWFAPPLCPIDLDQESTHDDSLFDGWDDITKELLHARCESHGGIWFVGIHSVVRYLDCTVLRNRIDDVLSNFLVTRSDTLVMRALVDADTFNLPRTKKFAINKLLSDVDLFKSSGWTEIKKHLSKAVLLEIIQAFAEQE